MRIRLLAVLLLALLFRAPGFADTVYLANGRSFEGVIADVSDNAVRIQMPGGSLSLPRDHVLRVEKSESDFAEYMRRKATLRRGGAATAEDWLGLARWAKAQGLEQGAREAALLAADLDPHLSGLAPLLRGQGYVLDEQLDRWLPYADFMRRRGFVQSAGQWISREEQAARQRAEQEERARRSAERAARAAQAASEAELALAESALRDRAYAAEAPVAGYGVPYTMFPWYISVPSGPHPHRGPHGGHPGPRPPMGHGNSFTHVPGSLIPGTLGGSGQR